MSKQYDEYLKEHKDNVFKGFCWLKENLPEIFDKGSENLTNSFISDCEYQCRYEHDKSKDNIDEYVPYDDYFYGDKSYEVVKNFNEAWLKHIHRNAHHWQHWVLINDDPNEGEILIDMPDIFIIEMICDWWSFSWKKGDLNEIFNWYDERKTHIKLSNITRENVEYILYKIKEKLDEKGYSRV